MLLCAGGRYDGLGLNASFKVKNGRSSLPNAGFGGQANSAAG